MQLILDTHGLVIRQRNRSFLIESKEQKRTISPQKVSSIAVTADCLFSTAALRLAAENKIPVYLVDESGEIDGKLYSPYFTGLAMQRKAQAIWVDSPDALQWMLSLGIQKTQNQKSHLQKLILSGNASQKVLDTIEILEATTLRFQKEANRDDLDFDSVRQRFFGLEGGAARQYWQALSEMLPIEWKFENRSRRPALDPFNAALNYLYGMLYPVVELAIFDACLDPYIGVLHADEYDRPALTFDCIEPFRAWADELLVALCKEGKLDIYCFDNKNEGWWLNKKGKAQLIPAFNTFLSTKRNDQGRTETVRNHIYIFAGQLAKKIMHWRQNH